MQLLIKLFSELIPIRNQLTIIIQMHIIYALSVLRSWIRLWQYLNPIFLLSLCDYWEFIWTHGPFLQLLGTTTHLFYHHLSFEDILRILYFRCVLCDIKVSLTFGWEHNANLTYVTTNISSISLLDLERAAAWRHGQQWHGCSLMIDAIWGGRPPHSNSINSIGRIP